MKQKEEAGSSARLKFLSISLLVIILDQLAKYLAVTKLSFGSYPVISNLLYFTLVRNTGAAFGTFQNQNLLLTIITIAVIIVAGNYLLKSKGTMLGISLTLIIGGAIGNLIDRFRLGYVIDFIDINFWPVFNLADSAVTIGCIILLFLISCPKKVPEEFSW